MSALRCCSRLTCIAQKIAACSKYPPPPLPQRDPPGIGYAYHGDERDDCPRMVRTPHKSQGICLSIGQSSRTLVFPLGTRAPLSAVVYARLTNTLHSGVFGDRPALTHWVNDCGGLLDLTPQGRDAARAAFLDTAPFPPVMTFLPHAYALGSRFPPPSPSFIQLHNALGAMLGIVTSLFGAACELVAPLSLVWHTTLHDYFRAAVVAAAVHSPASAIDHHALDRLATPILVRLFDDAVANWFRHAASALRTPFLDAVPDHLGHVQLPPVALKPFAAFFPDAPPASFTFPSAAGPAAAPAAAAPSASGSARPRKSGHGPVNGDKAAPADPAAAPAGAPPQGGQHPHRCCRCQGPPGCCPGPRRRRGCHLPLGPHGD